MGAILKVSLILASAVAIGVYFYESPDGENPGRTPALKEAPIAPPGPAEDVGVDEELDYLAARRIGSVEGWRTFLADHPAGHYAASAEAAIRTLLPDADGGAPIAQAPKDAAVNAQTAIGSNSLDPTPSETGHPAVAATDEICKREEVRLAQLRANPSNDETARFLKEALCEELRPQLLAFAAEGSRSMQAAKALSVSDGSPEAEPAKEGAEPSGPADTLVARAAPDESAASQSEITRQRDRPTSSADTRAATLPPDEACRRDEQRLEGLRSSRSRDEITRFAGELNCEKLRPQLLRMEESLGEAPAPATSASETPPVKRDLGQGPATASECVSEQAALTRIRKEPSADAAQGLWRNLRCERLRPQIRLLLESLNAAADPSGACRHEAEELNRIRANPQRREAEDFTRDMKCDLLKPQARRLLESVSE